MAMNCAMWTKISYGVPVKVPKLIKLCPKFLSAPDYRFLFQSISKAEIFLSRASSSYTTAFKKSIERPEEFWAEAAEKVNWYEKWDRVLDNSRPPYSQWFVGGEMNTCYNAIDRHIESGRGEQIALIHDSPVTDSKTHITYKQLFTLVRDLAGALRAQGVEKGDVVLIYMPMIPEAVAAMMACSRIGAVHNLVFGGFAAKELSTRISHSQPKVVVSANCGVEPTRTVPYKPLLDQAIEISDWKPRRCIIFNRSKFEEASLIPGRDVEWNEAISQGRPADCVPVAATDPVYILYTSGTTGLPKGIVRPTGGHVVALNWTMPNIYNMYPGSVWWAASDLGWVVGHSYIAYAPLFIGATSVIYEGKPVGTPDASAFFRVLKEHQIEGMFVAPTALRAIRAEDPNGDKIKPFLPLKNLDALYVAGEHCDHETMNWIQALIDKPVLDHWWQTESGWALTATCRGLGMDPYPRPGLTGKPAPGWNVQVLRPDGIETATDELGEIFIKQPLPPGCMSTLFKNEEGFKQIYFSRMEGFYNTMDSGIRDKDGYISVLSRTDDVINVAGHRLSCGVLEEAVLECPDVVEAAVIGVPDELKGNIPLGLCVIRSVLAMERGCGWGEGGKWQTETGIVCVGSIVNVILDRVMTGE
ncbi:propionyl-coa synthetase [Plakobranchus ocellatus]|uniref:Acyl-CoA synthetase short-chain family member 3, mitochondrial n=1 Tax=Plakobranchus ocellatus TaxID=259542 RepID=A0AAV4A233_9GAST|nr:propionyl-coa synthetase [Plakobranchus ocellatus]